MRRSMEGEAIAGTGLFALRIDWMALGLGVLNTMVVVLVAILAWRICAKALSSLENRSRLSSGIMTPIRMVVRYGITLIAVLMLISS